MHILQKSFPNSSRLCRCAPFFVTNIHFLSQMKTYCPQQKLIVTQIHVNFFYKRPRTYITPCSCISFCSSLPLRKYDHWQHYCTFCIAAFSVRLQTQLANLASACQLAKANSDLRLQCLLLVLQNFLVLVGVPIIEQQKEGHISTVTCQKSAKL